MDLSTLLNIPDGWQDMETAPRDGTPILLSEGGMVGIYAFFDDGMTTISGQPMGPTWHGVHVASEFLPITKGGKPLPARARIMQMIGVEEIDAKWRCLPASHQPLFPTWNGT